METSTLKGEPRGERGTRRARLVRATGKLPAVVYGHGEPPESICLDRHEVEVALAHGARMLTVSLGAGSKPYLIKAVQYDHFGTTPVHMDLMRVDLHERVRVKVGIELRGTPKGVHDGGVLDQLLSALDVECVVTEIPETLHPVVTHLALGESLYVKDLVLPPGVTALTGPEERVATVRALLEAPAAAPPVEGEEAAAEPERIGRIRKEEGEAEAS
ncbi:MAG: 50S ribosomal protein L25 [Planctomycetes bacterium]|nr:50S ribosomal protein L25 [Planctomycetota bacterium]